MGRSRYLQILLGATLLCLTAPTLAWGADRKLSLPNSESAPPSIDTGSTLLKTLLALGFTILVIWGVYKLLRILGRGTSKGKSAAIEVLSRTELDRDMSVYVLRLGNQVSVVSKTQQGTALLREMSEEEAILAGLDSHIEESDQSPKSAWKDLRGFADKWLWQTKKADQQPASIDQLLGGFDDTALQQQTESGVPQGPMHLDDLMEKDSSLSPRQIDDLLKGMQ